MRLRRSHCKFPSIINLSIEDLHYKVTTTVIRSLWRQRKFDQRPARVDLGPVSSTVPISNRLERNKLVLAQMQSTAIMHNRMRSYHHVAAHQASDHHRRWPSSHDSNIDAIKAPLPTILLCLQKQARPNTTGTWLSFANAYISSWHPSKPAAPSEFVVLPDQVRILVD